MGARSRIILCPRRGRDVAIKVELLVCLSSSEAPGVGGDS